MSCPSTSLDFHSNQIKARPVPWKKLWETRGKKAKAKHFSCIYWFFPASGFVGPCWGTSAVPADGSAIPLASLTCCLCTSGPGWPDCDRQSQQHCEEQNPGSRFCAGKADAQLMCLCRLLYSTVFFLVLQEPVLLWRTFLSQQWSSPWMLLS